MSFFRPRTLAGNIWPPLPPQPEASQVWAAYRALDGTQWLSGKEIEHHQLAQVRSLLAHCIEHVPYYRQALTAAGIVPASIRTMTDFRRIPLLARRTFQERSAEFRARALPPGTVATGKAVTSGTQGIPIEVLQTNVVNLWWFAFLLRDLEWCGLDPCAKLAAVRATGKTGEDLQKALAGVALPFWGNQLNALIETGPSGFMDIHQEPRQQLQWLRRVNPDYLLSFPSNLEYLAELIREEGRRLPRLRAIQCIAETLTEDAQRRIEAGFGVPVKNTYSSQEAGYIASPCPAGPGLHVHAENVLLEVLDEADQPCLPGQAGRVVLTTLHNFLTPFVRYAILDEATLAPQPCSCGRSLPLLSRVQGRCLPLFRLPNGRRRSPSVLAIGVRNLGGHRQHQIIQRDVDHVVIRLVPGPDWTPEHPARIRQVAYEFFEAPVRVDFQLQDRLERPAGGKLRNVVSELERPEGTR